MRSARLVVNEIVIVIILLDLFRHSDIKRGAVNRWHELFQEWSGTAVCYKSTLGLRDLWISDNIKMAMWVERSLVLGEGLELK